MPVTIRSNLGNVAGGGVARSFKDEGLITVVATITLGLATDYVNTVGVVLTPALLLQVGMRKLFDAHINSIRTSANVYRQFLLWWDPVGSAIRAANALGAGGEITNANLANGDIIEALLLGV